MIRNRLMPILMTLSLVACDTVVLESDPAALSTTSVAATGGLATSDDNRLVLDFTSGALSVATDITIERRTATKPGLVSDLYELGPSGLTFAAPVRIEITAGPTNAYLVLANADGAEPLPIDNSTFDPATGTVTGELRHFSSYGAFSGIACAADTDCASGDVCIAGRCGDGEVCGNGVDDDFDGLVDEDCGCNVASCDDGDPCTDDSCDSNGCVHAAATDGTACDAGVPCGSGATCMADSCLAAPGCGGMPCSGDSDCSNGEVRAGGFCAPGTVCGNGRVESAEECDGGDLNRMSCIDLGYAGGPLVCGATCQFDSTGCSR